MMSCRPSHNAHCAERSQDTADDDDSKKASLEAMWRCGTSRVDVFWSEM